MTTTVTSAADLLRLQEPTFVALLKVWETKGQCPLPIVDVLLDYGLTVQAEAARWCATEPKRPPYWMVGGSKRRHPQPSKLGDHLWEWHPRFGAPEPLKYDEFLPTQIESGNPIGRSIEGKSFAEACCALFDKWRPDATH
jgi:hypothetical protein